MHGSTPLTNPIDVLIVDDAPDLTAMVSRLLSSEPDMRVVGVLHEAGPLAGAIARLRPRVVLLDLTMPGVSPLAALRESREARETADARVIIFSGYDDPETVAAARDAGACATLSKSDDPFTMIDAIRKAAAH